MIRELYTRHDINASASLDATELKTFMQEYVQTQPQHNFKIVSDDEVIYVMKMADTYGYGQINEEDVTEAVAVGPSISQPRSSAAAAAACCSE